MSCQGSICMKTRLPIVALWFFGAAYAGSMLNNIVGLPTIIGPGIGLLTAATVVLDPFARTAAKRQATHVPATFEREPSGARVLATR